MMKKKLFLFIGLFCITILANAQYVSQPITWSQGSVGTRDISVVDGNVVWATGYDADGAAPDVIIKQVALTTNGGTTWTVKDVTLSGDAEIYNIAAVSATTAFLMAYDQAAAVPSFWQTTDGGDNWSQVDLLFGGPSSFANGVSFWEDHMHGFCHGDYDANTDEYEIYYTEDGGSSWQQASSVPTVNETDEYSFNGNDQMTYAGQTAYIITNYGRVLKTSDYGNNWDYTGSAPYSGTVKYDNVQIFAASENIVLCRFGSGTPFVWDDHYMRSDDGGETWTQLAPNGPMHKTSICRVPGTDNTLISCGSDPTVGAEDLGVSRSIDGGLNWVAEPGWLTSDTGDDLQALIVDYVNENLGFIGYFDAMIRYDKPVSVNTIESDVFSVSPNPSSAIFNVNLLNYKNVNVKVVDMVGKVVKSYNNVDTNLSIDLKDNSKGLYFININSGNINETIKVILK